MLEKRLTKHARHLHRLLIAGALSLSLLGLAGCSIGPKRSACYTPLSKAIIGKQITHTASLNKVLVDQFDIGTPAGINFNHEPDLFKQGTVNTYVGSPKASIATNVPSDIEASGYAYDSYRAMKLLGNSKRDNPGDGQRIYYHINNHKKLLTLSSPHRYGNSITSITYKLMSNYTDNSFMTTINNIFTFKPIRLTRYGRHTIKEPSAVVGHQPIKVTKHGSYTVKVPSKVARQNLLHFDTSYVGIHGLVHKPKLHVKRFKHALKTKSTSLNDVR